MAENVEMKRCPYCNSKVLDWGNGTYSCGDDNKQGCPSAKILYYRDEWNTRPEEEKLQKQIDGLKKRCKHQTDIIIKLQMEIGAMKSA